MKKKIIIGCILVIGMLIMTANVSAANNILSSKSNDVENKINDEYLKQNSPLFELIYLYIEVMYSFRIFRADIWTSLAKVQAIGGTLGPFIDFRVALLELRADASRQLAIALIDLFQDVNP